MRGGGIYCLVPGARSTCEPDTFYAAGMACEGARMRTQWCGGHPSPCRSVATHDSTRASNEAAAEEAAAQRQERQWRQSCVQQVAPGAAGDALGGSDASPLDEAAAAAWQQQAYVQQQLAVAEGLDGTAKRQHLGAHPGGAVRAGSYTLLTARLIAAQASQSSCRCLSQAAPQPTPHPCALADAVAQQLHAATGADPRVISQQLQALAAAGGAVAGYSTAAPGGGWASGAHAAGGTGGGGAGGGAPVVPDELAFSKKPRPVEFTPYGMRDYEARAYDPKRAQGYWELGRLGAASECPDVLAKVCMAPVGTGRG